MIFNPWWVGLTLFGREGLKAFMGSPPWLVDGFIPSAFIERV